MDFGIAFALGLLGSLHCAAMCGPLMLALPVLPGSPMRFVGGRLTYQLGRVSTYASLGVVGGLAGKSLFFIGAQRWLSIALGLGVLLGFFVSKRISMARPVTRFVAVLKTGMSAQLQQRGFRSLALLGMMNGLLPCGLVYAALAGAVSQGTVGKSVIFMAIFGLGTLPTMLAASLSGKIFPFAVRLKLRRLIPAGVCVLAGLLILRGLALGIPYLSPDLAASGSACCAH
jgi:sulfite exporter TauE/SafE